MQPTLNRTLAQNIGMPMIGFGTWQIPAIDAERIVSNAINAGYTHIDCAHVYGNEAEIGKAFTAHKNREKLYIVSKLWSTDHQISHVRPALHKTLANLQLDYLDMYLIHNPTRLSSNSEPLWYKKEWLIETWREMVKLLEAGYAKNIGVSNFSTTKLQWLIDDGVTPSNNQVEMHPYLKQTKLLKFCNDNGIAVTAYSPLGTPGTPHRLPALCDTSAPILLEDKTIQEIATKRSLTPAQVLLKWGIDRGTPVLVKSSSPERLKMNLQAESVELTQEDMQLINGISTQYRYLDFKIFCSGVGHSVQEYWDDEYFN